MEVICYSCGRGENPENTLEGIEHCLSVNPDWRIEMDIQLTNDGQLVLFHDENLNRITGDTRVLSKLTLGEVADLNAGYNYKLRDEFIYRKEPLRIPKLEIVFIQYPQAKLLLDVHTSDLSVVDKLIALIEKHQLKDFIIVSGYDKIIVAFKSKQPSWIYGAATIEAKKIIYSSFLFLDGLFPIKSDYLMLPVMYGNVKVLTPRVIRHAKKRNKKVWAWMYEGEVVRTIETKKELEHLEEMGVDGIFTDYPKALSEELKL